MKVCSSVILKNLSAFSPQAGFIMPVGCEHCNSSSMHTYYVCIHISGWWMLTSFCCLDEWKQVVMADSLKDPVLMILSLASEIDTIMHGLHTNASVTSNLILKKFRESNTVQVNGCCHVLTIYAIEQQLWRHFAVKLLDHFFRLLCLMRIFIALNPNCETSMFSLLFRLQCLLPCFEVILFLMILYRER